MEKTKSIREYCRALKLGNIGEKIDEIISNAQKQSPSYIEYTASLFYSEILYRQQKDALKRKKAARLPLNFNLGLYDFSSISGLDKTQLNQLRELHWLEQNFNILLMGPSGI